MRWMTLDDVATTHGGDRNALLAEIRSRLSLSEGEAAVASGSLVEGIGTRTSDLDVFVIGSPRASGDFGSMQIFEVAGTPVDVTYVEFAYLENLLDTLGELPADQDRDPRTALRLSPDARDLLHRLSIAVPFVGAEAFEALRARIDTRSLSRLLVDRATVRVGTAHQDLVGLVAQSDFHSCIYLHQVVLGFTADAVLGALGCTNPAEKWRLRLLARHSQQWDGHVPGSSLNTPSVAEYFAALHAGMSEQSQIDQILRAIHLSNRVIPWARSTFLDRTVEGSPGVLSQERKAWRRPGDKLLAPIVAKMRKPDIPFEAIQAQRPRLHLAAQLRYRNGQLLLQHLETGGTLQVNHVAYHLLSWLDGSRSVGEAVDAVCAAFDLDRNGLEIAATDLYQFLVLRSCWSDSTLCVGPDDREKAGDTPVDRSA